MKKVILNSYFIFSISLLFSAAIIFHSCKKEEDEDKQVDVKMSQVLSQENLNVISDVSAIYEKSILDVVQAPSTDLKSNTNKEESINSLFSKRCDEYFAKYGKLKSSTENEFANLDLPKLQVYLDDFSNGLITKYESLSDNVATEDFILNDIKTELASFNDIIAIDNTLSLSEKQYLVNFANTRFNLAAVTIKYGEEISGSSTNLKSLKSCNWWCRNKKKVECSLVTASAASICSTVATAVTAIACASATYKAVNCWDSI